MNPKTYGMLVMGVEDSFWDDFEEVMLGYYDHSPRAKGIINEAIYRLERKGWKIDPEAEDALLAFVDGYDTKRTNGFLRRRSLALPDNFMQNVILLFTVPYPNDVPVRKTPTRRNALSVFDLMAEFPEAEEVFGGDV